VKVLVPVSAFENVTVCRNFKCQGTSSVGQGWGCPDHPIQELIKANLDGYFFSTKKVT